MAPYLCCLVELGRYVTEADVCPSAWACFCPPPYIIPVCYCIIVRSKLSDNLAEFVAKSCCCHSNRTFGSSTILDDAVNDYGNDCCPYMITIVTRIWRE